MPEQLNINESFICRIWEGAELYLDSLATDDGLPVEIIDFGKPNHDSGPDYKDAKIRIGEKIMAGDVEVHRDFKGWFEHSHKSDSAYNSVILQVVLWDTGKELKPKLRRKRDVPTVILADHLKTSIHEIWQEIISNPSEKFRLQCSGKNCSMTPLELERYMQRLATVRLSLKALRMKNRMKELCREMFECAYSKDMTKKEMLWKQVLYEFSFEALGYAKNKEPMMKLASALKLPVLEKSFKNSDLKHIQALLFGTSGLFFDLRISDSYITNIKAIWNEEKDKLTGQVINKAEWKFFRMRPTNFPTLRIAYGAQLIKRIMNRGLFKNIITEFKSAKFKTDSCFKALMSMLEAEYDSYWSVHYNFGKLNKKPNYLLGKERAIDIITNVILPLAYLYSSDFKESQMKFNVLKFYSEFKISASNSIVEVISDQVLKERGLKVNTPALEQASIQLYNFYCTREKCAECRIGQSVSAPGFNYQIIFY